MIKFNNLIKTETYIELDAEDGGKMFMPASATIFVDDNSNAISVKTTGSRKTIGYVVSGGTPPVPPVPPTPTIDGKWKATYNDGHVESAECGSSTEIVWNEIHDEKNVTSIEIGDCVTDIGSFGHCSGLTSVAVGTGVTSVGVQCFYECVNLKRFNSNDDGECNIPSGFISVGPTSFYKCTSFTHINIPDTVTSIGAGAFRLCSGLASITCLAVTPPTLANNIAFHDTNDCPIYVPAESVDAYKSATNWSTYADRIQAIP